MNIGIRPLDAPVGAEIVDVDMSQPIDSETQAELVKAWQDHSVLIFRRQLLEEDDLVRFGAGFGPLEKVIRKDMVSPYNPYVNYISCLRYDDGRHIGALGADELGWHTDQTYMKEPSTGAILYGVAVPPEGGNTYFANQYLAYESLSPETKKTIEGRNGVFNYHFRIKAYQKEAAKMARTVRDKNPDTDHPDETLDVLHPLVLVNPADGRKSLFADCSTMPRIEGLPEDESQAIRQELHQAATQNPDIVYTHKWHVGDVVYWDNGCTMHKRDHFDLYSLRLLKRVNIFLPKDQFCVPH